MSRIDLPGHSCRPRTEVDPRAPAISSNLAFQRAPRRDDGCATAPVGPNRSIDRASISDATALGEPSNSVSVIRRILGHRGLINSMELMNSHKATQIVLLLLVVTILTLVAAERTFTRLERVRVKVLEVDRQGRVRLSMRNVDAA